MIPSEQKYARQSLGHALKVYNWPKTPPYLQIIKFVLRGLTKTKFKELIGGRPIFYVRYYISEQILYLPYKQHSVFGRICMMVKNYQWITGTLKFTLVLIRSLIQSA